MGRAGGHIERRRDQHHPRLGQRHQPRQLRKPDIVADTQAHPSKFRVKYRHFIARRQGVRLPELLAPVHMDVEQVHFPVAGNLMALPVKDIGRVVNLAPQPQFRHGPGGQIHPIGLGQIGAPPPEGAAHGFGVLGKGGGIIGTAEHLRQGHQIGPRRRGLFHPPGHRVEGVFLAGADLALDLINLHNILHGISSYPPQYIILWSFRAGCFAETHRFFPLCPITRRAPSVLY